MVSICECVVSNKRGLPCHCLGDCGGYAPTPYILSGQLAPLPLSLPGSAAYGTDRDQRTHAIAYATLSILLYGSTSKQWSGHCLTCPTSSYAYAQHGHSPLTAPITFSMHMLILKEMQRKLSFLARLAMHGYICVLKYYTIESGV